MKIRVIYTDFPGFIGDRCVYMSEEEADSDLDYIEGIRPMKEMLSPYGVDSAFTDDIIDTEEDDPCDTKWEDFIRSLFFGTTSYKDKPKELVLWALRGVIKDDNDLYNDNNCIYETAVIEDVKNMYPEFIKEFENVDTK